MTAIEAEDLPAPPPLSAIARASLFLDLDGTLAAIEPRPDDVRAEPRRTSLLKRLAGRLDGRLAVVSGRTLEEVDRILEGAAPAAAGVHGLVRRRADGTVVRVPASPGLAQALETARAMAAGRPGLLTEDKGSSFTIHFRQAPGLGPMVKASAEQLARLHGLKLQGGDMVVELLTPGCDKGLAVRAFMAEPPFAGSTPVFVGDDLTDEDGFAAAAALDGFGVLAGRMRRTAAGRRLEDVAAVLDWLEAGLAGGGRP